MLTLRKIHFLLEQLKKQDDKQLDQPALFHSPYFERTYPVVAFGEVKENEPNSPVLAFLGNNFN